MMAQGIENLGSMVLLGNVPCIRCGYGDDYPVSGLKMIHGPEAALASVEAHSFGDGPAAGRRRELAEACKW